MESGRTVAQRQPTIAELAMRRTASTPARAGAPSSRQIRYARMSDAAVARKEKSRPAIKQVGSPSNPIWTNGQAAAPTIR